jgi:hypothetical protein
VKPGSSDDHVAERLRHVELSLLHEQAVLPSLIRDLDGIDDAAHIQEQLQQWQSQVPEWARELRSLRELLQA